MSQIRLKICGVQTVQEARHLRFAGVDLIGLNFVPTSRRRISLTMALAIVEELADADIQIVGLFQNQPIALVNDYSERIGADYVQLHGIENTEYVQQVTTPVIKAIAVDAEATTASIVQTIDNCPAELFILDRQTQGQGDCVSLELAQSVIERFPDQIIIAGGLNQENIEPVLALRPCGIDIANGVRSGDELDIAKVEACLTLVADSSH